MSNQEQIEQLANLAKNLHGVELQCKIEVKHGVHAAAANANYHFRAIQHLEHARMYAGDLLRLAVLGKEHRQTSFFAVADHGGRHTDPVQLMEDEKAFIQWAKQELRRLFYQLSDMDADIEGTWIDVPAGVNRSEWRLYGCQLMIHIKEADQCLGLWLGAILEHQKNEPAAADHQPRKFPEGGIVYGPPPSAFIIDQFHDGNQVGEIVVPLEKLRAALRDSNDKGPISFQSFQEADIQNEQLFNDIMEELGPPNLCVKALCQGKPMSYPQEKVVEVLRKYLDLPVKPETLKP